MTKNMISAILAIVLGVFYFASAMTLPAHTNMGDIMGPRLFPIVVAATCVIAGIALVLVEFFGKHRAKSEKADFGFVKNKAVWIDIALLTAAGIIYGMLLDPLGFTVATLLFMFAAAMLINRGRIVQNITVAAIFTVAAYGVFGFGLKLSLPRGLVENLLPF